MRNLVARLKDSCRDARRGFEDCDAFSCAILNMDEVMSDPFFIEEPLNHHTDFSAHEPSRDGFYTKPGELTCDIDAFSSWNHLSFSCTRDLPMTKPIHVNCFVEHWVEGNSRD